MWLKVRFPVRGNLYAINMDTVRTVSAWIEFVEDDNGVMQEIKTVHFVYVTEHSPQPFPVDDETYDRVRKFIDAIPD